MPIIMPDAPRQQQKQEKESILELLGRGFATGAGQSLGTGLGQLATQGLGNLMDPNMRPLTAQSLEMLGLDQAQAKSVSSIRNPAVQRDIVNSMQQRKAETKEKERKQRLASQYAQQVAQITGQNIGGQPVQQKGQQMQPGMEQQAQPQQQTPKGTDIPLQENDVDEIINDLPTMKNLQQVAQKQQAHDLKKEHYTEEGKRADHRDTKEGHKSRKAGWELGNELVVGATKMEALDEEDKLDSPGKVKLLKAIGMDQLLSPESALYNKIRASYMTGAAKAVKGHATEKQLEAHMERFPSLMISKEGRKLIYKDMKMMGELERESYNIEREIVKKNDGYRPRDIDYQVDERMADVYKRYEKKFMDNIAEGKKLAPLSKDEEMPASEYKNKVRQLDDGSYEMSDGKDWNPVGTPHKGTSSQESTFNSNEY